MTTQVPIDFERAAEEARARRDEGMQRAADHANAVESEWTGQALGHLIAFATEVRRPFLIEEARAWAESHGCPNPPTPKAWGPVTKNAERKGRIAKCGSAPANSSNRSLKHLWRLVA